MDDSEEPPNWADINADILIKIFQKLTLVDLLFGVPLVCRSWREASLNPLCWRSLDLNSWESMFTRIVPRGSHPIILDFKKFLKFVVNRGYGTLTSIIFPRKDVTDGTLLYVAKSCPRLKSLDLQGYCDISKDALRKAIRNWADLEVIDIILPPLFCKEVIYEIGRYCRNFVQLGTRGWISEEEVLVVATELPKLKILNLSYSTLTNKGLVALLDGCTALECLDVTNCFCLKLNEEILEKASRLKAFEYGSVDFDRDDRNVPFGCYMYEEYVFGDDGECHREVHMIFH